jgi:glutamyl-tRNA reductase
MSIVLAGISHKTAPIEVRELLAFTDEMCSEGLRALVDGRVGREGLIVSTCNRVEVLATINPDHPEEGESRVKAFLTDVRAIPSDMLSKHFYTHSDVVAVRHLFRVASSLDSMVVGEPQVLGQVRRSYKLAVERGTAGRVLHRLMHHAFHTAKRVRTETGIAANAVSVSSVAVDLGRKVLGSFEGCTALLVGAGEMAQLAARQLRSAGTSRLLVMNRTDLTAMQLADEYGGEQVPFAALGSRLAEADIVICSTSAPDYIISPEMTRRALDERCNRPVVFVDIWRAVDQDGNVLDILVQNRRDKNAAKRFFRKLLKGLQYVPRVIITDKLGSYSAAKAEVMASVEHQQHKGLNNRAENSTRLRERVMRRFKSTGQAQRFLSAFEIISQHFRPKRHELTAQQGRDEMKMRFGTWQEVVSILSAA